MATCLSSLCVPVFFCLANVSSRCGFLGFDWIYSHPPDPFSCRVCLALALRAQALCGPTTSLGFIARGPRVLVDSAFYFKICVAARGCRLTVYAWRPGVLHECRPQQRLICYVCRDARTSARTLLLAFATRVPRICVSRPRPPAQNPWPGPMAARRVGRQVPVVLPVIFCVGFRDRSSSFCRFALLSHPPCVFPIEKAR